MPLWKRNSAAAAAPTPRYRSPRKPGTVRTSFGVLDWRDWIAWRHWWKYLILVIIAVLGALLTVLHDQIVDSLEPSFRALRDWSLGWLVPILIITIISVPPLAGHEIIILLTGAVWDEHFGLIAFGIVSAGTILGEWLDYWLFKRHYFKSKVDAQVESNLLWACMAHVCRLPGIKGVWTALVIRLSFIPGHLTTPVFSAAGMGFRIFTIAAILSLPKQYAIVYLGTLFVQDKSEKTTTSKIITSVTLVVTGLVSLFACWYVYVELKKAIPKADPTGRLRHKLYPEDFPAPAGVPDESRTPLTAQGASFAMSTVSLAGADDEKRRAAQTYGLGDSTSTVALEGGYGGYPYGGTNASTSSYHVGGGVAQGQGRQGGKGMRYEAYQPEYPPALPAGYAGQGRDPRDPRAAGGAAGGGYGNGRTAGGGGGYGGYSDPYAQQPSDRSELPYRTGPSSHAANPSRQNSSQAPSYYPPPRQDPYAVVPSRALTQPQDHQPRSPVEQPRSPIQPSPSQAQMGRSRTQEDARRRYVEASEETVVVKDGPPGDWEKFPRESTEDGNAAGSRSRSQSQSQARKKTLSPPPVQQQERLRQEDGRKRYELNDGDDQSWRR